MAAALPIFATQGYTQARVSDIAHRVGITEPVVFRHFRTKAELFAAVLERASDVVTGQLARAAQSEGEDVFNLLAALLSAEHLDRLHQRGGLGVIFTDAAAAADDHGFVIQQAAQRARARVVTALGELLERGQRAGTVRTDSTPTTLAWAVLALIHAREFGRAHAGDSFPPVNRELVRLMRELVQARGAAT